MKVFLALLLAAEPVFALGGGHLPAPPLPPPPLPPFVPQAPKYAPTGHGPGDASRTKAGTGGPATGVPTGGAAPSGPSTAGGAPGKTGGPGGTGPATGAPAVDVTTWEYWWLYNKDAYVDLKRHVAAFVPTSGLDAEEAAKAQWDRAGEELLPELLKALQASDDHDVQLSAMIALSRLCDGAARARVGEIATACVERETDGNRAVAEVAVMALGVLGHEPTVIDLCALVRDTKEARKRFLGKAVPERTRAFAALALGLIGARTGNRDARAYAASALAGQLEMEAGAQPDLETACVIALGLIPLATNDDGAPPSRAGKPGAAERASLPARLIALFADGKSSPFVRAHLPRSLARMAGEGPWRAAVVQALLTRVADRNEKNEVVQGCVLALGALGGAGPSPLELGTAGPNRLDRDDVRAALVRQMESGDLQARCFARIALAQCAGRGPDGASVTDVRNLLVRALQNGSGRERCWSALALGVLEHARRGDGACAKTSADMLERVLREARSPEEVGALAIGCGLAGVKGAAPALIAHLGTVHEVRAQGYVGLALGLLDARDAVEPLRALLVESRKCSEKLPQTALALALLEDPKLVPDLLGLLDQGTSQSTVGASLAALGTVGDRRAIPAVLALLKDAASSNYLRAASIAALGRIADRDRLPWQHAVSAGLNYRAMTTTLSDESHGGLLDLQ